MAEYKLKSVTSSLVILYFLFAYQVDNVFALTEYEHKYTRQLTKTSINHDCNMTWCLNTNHTENGLLAYTVAKGPKDDIHHLFSTVGAPTLLMSRTDKNSQIEIDYDTLLHEYGQAINYTKEPEHSFGIIFSHLYEYDDQKDEADMTLYKDNSSANIKYDLMNLIWTLDELQTSDSDYQEVVLNATGTYDEKGTLFAHDGYISFRVRYDAKDGRLTGRPHMEHTANSSMVTVVMSNLNCSFPNSRFAVELIMFSTSKKGELKENMFSHVATSQSLDDEYSPGVFQMYNWEADPSEKEPWGYAQWKPVMYTKVTRLNADLSHAKTYANYPYSRSFLLDNTLPNRSLFHVYFYEDFSSVSLNVTNVSFGQTNDKFYANTKYLVWTMGVGLGPPPSDDVSITVILVIAVGLGIPLVLMIFSTIFVFVRNRKQDRLKSTYQSIND